MTDYPITPPPPHLLKKFSAQARDERSKRNGTGYLKTFATLCIEWAMNCQATPNDRQIRSSEIQPPPELVEQWRNEWIERREPSGWVGYCIATQAARWGADQELLACGNYLEKCASWEPEDVTEFYNYRRPRPLGLKELALASVKRFEESGEFFSDQMRELEFIRKALETLND